MIDLGNVTVHWTINATAPPPNYCTGDSPQAAPFDTAAAPGGVLHMAVEGETSGGYPSLQAPLRLATGGTCDVAPACPESSQLIQGQGGGGQPKQAASSP